MRNVKRRPKRNNATATIHGIYKGFPITLQFEMSAGVLEAVLQRLEHYGIEPPPHSESNPTMNEWLWTPSKGDDGVVQLPICPKHHHVMEKRSELGGDIWYGHRIVRDGHTYWCRGYRTESPNDGYDLD